MTTLLQFLPQIWNIFRRKDPGSYSVLTVALQMPGSIGWAAYLAFGGGGTKLTSWLPQMVTGGFQAILLVMCLYYTRWHV